MKSHTEHLTFNVPQRMDFVNITRQVEQAVRGQPVTPLEDHAPLVERIESRFLTPTASAKVK